MTFIEERVIMKKRKCKHGCGTEIYLQYLPVTPTLRWIAFNSTTGEIHSCPNKPLDSKIRKLIGKAIERMNYHNTSTSNISLLLNNIDIITDKLNDLKRNINNISYPDY